MKSVKVTAVSSLFVMMLAFPLAACTADVTPNEPEVVVQHTAKSPAAGPGAGGAKDSTNGLTPQGKRPMADNPLGEPLPNPWDPNPDGTNPLNGVVQLPAAGQDFDVAAGGARVPAHQVVPEDPENARYRGPSGTQAF
jgi:hypothetical protein